MFDVTELELKLTSAAISSFKRYGDTLSSAAAARAPRSSTPRSEEGLLDSSGAARPSSRSADQLLTPANSSDSVAPKVKKTLSDRLKKIRKKAGQVVLYLDYSGSSPPKIRRASSAPVKVKAKAKAKAPHAEPSASAASGGGASGATRPLAGAGAAAAGSAARSSEASPKVGAAHDARADGADELLLEQAFTVIEVLCTSAAMCISSTGMLRSSEASLPSRCLAFRLIFGKDKVSRRSAILPPIARIAECSGVSSPKWQLRAVRLLARIVRMLSATVSQSGLARKLPTHAVWRGGDGWVKAQPPRPASAEISVLTSAVENVHAQIEAFDPWLSELLSGLQRREGGVDEYGLPVASRLAQALLSLAAARDRVLEQRSLIVSSSPAGGGARRGDIQEGEARGAVAASPSPLGAPPAAPRRSLSNPLDGRPAGAWSAPVQRGESSSAAMAHQRPELEFAWELEFEWQWQLRDACGALRSAGGGKPGGKAGGGADSGAPFDGAAALVIKHLENLVGR